MPNIYFFDKQNFYKLKLNFYCFNTEHLHISEKHKREFIDTRVHLFNNDACYLSKSLAQYTICTEYLPFYWKLQRLLWFTRLCFVSQKRFRKKVLLLSEFDNFGNIAMYFAKKYDQQYLIHWLPGLISNKVFMLKYFIRSYSLAYLFNLSYITPDFTIFIENKSKQMAVAFNEVCSGHITYPFVLFSIEDYYFSPLSGFLVIKSAVNIYFYIAMFFSLMYQKRSVCCF